MLITTLSLFGRAWQTNYFYNIKATSNCFIPENTGIRYNYLPFCLPKNPSVPVEMKFAGLLNNQPMFQLSFYGNAQQDEFTISIRDENGNSLYRENIKGENFTKKFLLNTDEIGDDTLLFEILSKKPVKQSYIA
ncbi:MAG: hypothetical protein IPI68_14955 [Chitinophagaceae bacterium]|nr:hypothetical protein [Chitinophagaceae bacterium]